MFIYIVLLIHLQTCLLFGEKSSEDTSYVMGNFLLDYWLLFLFVFMRPPFSPGTTLIAGENVHILDLENGMIKFHLVAMCSY